MANYGVVNVGSYLIVYFQNPDESGLSLKMCTLIFYHPCVAVFASFETTLHIQAAILRDGTVFPWRSNVPIRYKMCRSCKDGWVTNLFSDHTILPLHTTNITTTLLLLLPFTNKEHCHNCKLLFTTFFRCWYILWWFLSINFYICMMIYNYMYI